MWHSCVIFVSGFVIHRSLKWKGQVKRGGVILHGMQAVLLSISHYSFPPPSFFSLVSAQKFLPLGATWEGDQWIALEGRFHSSEFCLPFFRYKSMSQAWNLPFWDTLVLFLRKDLQRSSFQFFLEIIASTAKTCSAEIPCEQPSYSTIIPLDWSSNVLVCKPMHTYLGIGLNQQSGTYFQGSMCCVPWCRKYMAKNCFDIYFSQYFCS